MIYKVIFIVTIIILILTIFILIRVNKCQNNCQNNCPLPHSNAMLGDGPPPAGYKPIFVFQNNTQYRLEASKGAAYSAYDKLNPPIGQSLTPNSTYSYFEVSWILFDLYDSDNNHVGLVTISLKVPADKYPYLIVSKFESACNWSGVKKGPPLNAIFSVDYVGEDPSTNRPKVLLNCKNCDPTLPCQALPPKITIGDQKWYGDYGDDQFNLVEYFIHQKPTGRGGRLYLGAGPGVIVPTQQGKCQWAVTGQWQIDIYLGHNTRPCWCECFYLAGRSSDCTDYRDANTNPGVTEIDICETTWAGCKSHTTNIQKFGGVSQDGGCSTAPAVENVWITVGARITNTTCEIYYCTKTDRKRDSPVTTNKVVLPAGKTHSAQLVPYLGTWCIKPCQLPNDKCSNNDDFETVWSNYFYSSNTDGPLAALNS